MDFFIKRDLLFITQSDVTGADKVIIKTAEYLAEQGHNVQVLVSKKTGHNPLICEIPPLQMPPPKLGEYIHEDGIYEMVDRDEKYLFVSINEHKPYQTTDFLLKHLQFNPNLIFVGSSPLFLKTIDIANLSEATKAIVYYACVDMNPLTGGSHFAWDYNGYQTGDFSNTPVIKDEKFKHLPQRNFNIKKELKEKHNFRVLCGTEWTKKQAEKSLLYKDQEWIPNISGIIDPDVFFPEHREIAKKVFNLDEKKFYILIGSENSLDERKGYKYAIEALNIFWNTLSEREREKVVVLSVGKIINPNNKDTPFQSQHIDYIKDERLLAQLYKASNLFINSSIEDSGPSMLIENLACGTPVVSFNMGAAPEFIENGKTGFIAENKNAEELANGILKVFKLSPKERLKLGQKASKRLMKTGSKANVIKVLNDIFDYHHTELELYRKIESSVALCTYNGEKYLTEQLDSILNQDLPVSEIIVCDDKSIDSTWKILQEYQVKYPDIIKIYQNNTNLGIVKNFEKAINLCTKEIVFLCDQDDVWFPNKTERVISAFKTTGAEAVCHNLQICTENKEWSKYTMWDSTGFATYFKHYKDIIKPVEYALFLGNMVTGAGFAFRKRTDIHLLDEQNVIHDYQLALKYIQSNDIFFFNEVLGLYRQHKNQKIGAVLDKVKQHSEMVHHYCLGDNIHWKFNFMKNRGQTEGIFSYINKRIKNKRIFTEMSKNDNSANDLNDLLKLKENILLENLNLYMKYFSVSERVKILLSLLKNNNGRLVLLKIKSAIQARTKYNNFG